MRPPLALSAVFIDAEGRESTYWSGARPKDRPLGVSFSTRIGDGFSNGNLTLPRRFDDESPDIGLYDSVVLVADDGQIAYEGRIGGAPRSTADGGRIQVQTVGHIAHAKDRKFTEIYVDRDMSGWGEASLNRRGALNTANRKYESPSLSADESGSPAVVTQLSGPWTANSTSETLYDAGAGNLIGAIWYRWERGANTDNTNVNWSWSVATFTDDTLATGNNTGDLRAAGPGSGYFTPSANRRYGHAQLLHGIAAGAAGTQYPLFWRFAVYGAHGLTRRGDDPGGFYASDVMENIVQRFCPKLRWGGQDTTLVIPHIVFKERTHPYDALLLLNGPHNYKLGVYENQTVVFEPYDLSDYDWQVRSDDPGVEVSFDGPTTDGLANYVVVEFDNVETGQRDSVGPDDSDELEDTSVDHPANRHGLDVELTVGLTFPTTSDIAIQFGRSYLAEFNRPKMRGQITVQGHLRDRAGHWKQAWLPRYGDTIAVVDALNDEPRLITETTYDDATRTVTISTDNGELNLLDAVVGYIESSLVAKGLR